jgi:hypothetical protein
MSLSGSIASYRHQAKYFDGQCDGKIESASREVYGFYRINRLPANRFDGKSDGKNFFVILFLIFTVKPDLKLLKSLQITEFFALQIVGLGNS